MNVAEGDYLPIVRVAPVYPARALSRGLEGYVDMGFTVTTTGTVKDPVVLFSTSRPSTSGTPSLMTASSNR